jgi:aspartate kinase
MIVMKFGGTSVEDAAAIARAADIVRSRLPQQPVVVVSALARVTDTLLAMGQAAGGGHREQALELSRTLRERHYNVAGELLGTGLFTEFHAELESGFDALDELLRGIAAVGELTPRTQDNVLSFGERLSSAIVAAAFSARGLDSTLVDSRQCIVTDATHTRALPQMEETHARLNERLAPLLQRGRVPVMGGFMAATADGVPTTIGRGGSDFTAAIVGAVLGAACIEIWTDVDGMKTTDPRLCPEALRIKTISFDEAAELAYFGARVLHPATLLPAIQKNIPVLVLNSRNPKNEGTRITARAPRCRNVFKAIAAKRRITIVDVVAARMLMAHGFLKAIFEVFDRHRCPVDVVSTSEVSVSLTVDSNEAIPAVAADLAALADVKYEGRKAIVCLVGENIRGTPGIAAQVFAAISDINVRMISQGASEINLTFVIDEDQVPEAVRRLHSQFFSDPDPEVFARD